MAKQPTGRKLALAVKRLFEQQEDQYDRSGKTNFETGSWNGKMAKALEPELLKLYLDSAKSIRDVGMDEAKLVSRLQSQAKAEAQLLAARLNSTTTEWLEDGREPISVFGAERAATVGLTQGTEALNATKMEAAAMTKKTKKRWRTNKKGTVCPECRSLEGKTIPLAATFRSKGGLEAKHPPLHPNCFCEIETV